MKKYQLYITRKNSIPVLLFVSDSVSACEGFISFGDYHQEIGDRLQIVSGDDFELVSAYVIEGSEVYA